MTTNRTTIYFGNVVGPGGIEMDMEVKSEPESEDENCSDSESVYSITSSVEEVPMAQSPLVSFSDEDSDELEDEPEVRSLS